MNGETGNFTGYRETLLNKCRDRFQGAEGGEGSKQGASGGDPEDFTGNGICKGLACREHENIQNNWRDNGCAVSPGEGILLLASVPPAGV